MDADWEESGNNSSLGVVFGFFAVGDAATMNCSASVKMPKRIQKRLSESRGGTCTAEEIDAKLRGADLRRKKFHEWLSSKARPKPKSPSWSSQDEDLGQRLEAKLFAAEQKRLSLLTKDQVRLARLDELRQAAKTGVELCFKKERETLGTKVEHRVRQAEANRMLLQNANLQRRAALKERSARSLLQRTNRENKYKERIRAAISQKRAAAEKKRLRLMETEKKKAHARVMQARRVAKFVCHQREVERRRLKEQLDNRIQRARLQREEYLRLRGSFHNPTRMNLKQGDFLSRKLASCWRQFVRTRRTTFSLATEYVDLGINEKCVLSMPFEKLAYHIQSATTLKTLKSLLDRLENRYVLSQSSNQSGSENLDHLLKHLVSPNRRASSSSKATRRKTQTKKESKSQITQKLSRYAVRVVLCAYMILGNPDAVFSDQGERESQLADSAAIFVREFELLIEIILSGPNTSSSTKPHSFRSQLAAFDAAWQSYLYQFVVWKVKDARSLEDDLVRAACQLELSMMQTCKFTSDGQLGILTHDSKAIQKQVADDQKLLRDNVKNLSGDDGIVRMEAALSDMRVKYFEAKENGSLTPVSHISSPVLSSSPNPSPTLAETVNSDENVTRSKSVVRSLFVDGAPSTPQSELDVLVKDFSNEIIVNEFLHEDHVPSINSFETNDENEAILKAKIKETMEKAFWDGVMESLENDEPDYRRIVGLVSEVKVELCEMAPRLWKQEIHDSIDIKILTQILESGSHDMDYLGKILDYALSMLRKMSDPASEDEMKMAHQKLLSELSEFSSSSEGKLNNTSVVPIVKALKFVLDEIQVLKQKISKARIEMMAPILKGPSGVAYLQKAFSNNYGPPSDTRMKLPFTTQWASSLHNTLGEWDEHTHSLASSTTREAATQGLPHATALKSGGSIALLPKYSSLSFDASSSNSGNSDNECKGERLDVLLRLGLLKLVWGKEDLTKETLPETLILNFSRLRAVQGKLQNLILIATSTLVLRQIISSDGMATKTINVVDTLVSNSVMGLLDLVGRSKDVGIIEIIDTIISICSTATLAVKLEEKKEVMSRMVVKSLQAGDTVFESVSRSFYLACRSIMLGGHGNRGRSLANTTLRRVGASLLINQLVEALEVLFVIAKVSGQVHGLWYKNLLT